MDPKEREIFLAERQSGLGGTDMAAICGLNPYKSALQVYREKVGLAKDTEMNERMYWGIALEDVVRKRFNDDLLEQSDKKLWVQTDNLFYRHPEHKFLVGHVDGIICNGSEQGVVEIKTAGARMRDSFGEEGSDEVPESYFCQGMHYLGITGLPYCQFAVLFGGQEFVTFKIERNEKIIAEFVDRGKAFWNDHVLAEVAPEADASDSSKEALLEMFPRDAGTTKEATPEIIVAVNGHLDAKSLEKQMKDNKQGFANTIKEFMGDNAILVGDGIKVTWKNTKDGVKVKWENVAKELIEQLKRDNDYDSDDIALLIEQHSTPVSGTRRFLTKAL